MVSSRDHASPQLAGNAIPPSLEMRAGDPKMGTCVDTSTREELGGSFWVVPWPLTSSL